MPDEQPHPDDDRYTYRLQETEMQSVREVLAAVRSEIAVLDEILKRLDKNLFGNGQPGVIQTIQAKVASHDRIIWIATGAILAMQFLAGSGVVSLKGFIGK